MLKLNWLQLFAEGGDGASAGGGTAEAGPSGETAPVEDANLSRIPERAKKAYREAVAKHQPKAEPTVQNQETDSNKPQHLSYTDLIKSDEYKEEHKAYMDKTIKDRFKKYEGMEASNAKMSEALQVVATKYGLDPEADDFLDSLSSKIAEDNSYYEDYAEKHDISVEEARKNISLERKVKALEMQEEARKREEAQAEAVRTLRENSEKTKARFPEFDFETEMQNENFRRLCAITQGDTTAAYMALHWNEEIPRQVSRQAAQAKVAISNSIASNQGRPVESGLSNNPAAVVNAKPSYEGMNARQMREFAMKNFIKK